MVSTPEPTIDGDVDDPEHTTVNKAENTTGWDGERTCPISDLN